MFTSRQDVTQVSCVLVSPPRTHILQTCRTTEIKFTFVFLNFIIIQIPVTTVGVAAATTFWGMLDEVSRQNNFQHFVLFSPVFFLFTNQVLNIIFNI